MNSKARRPFEGVIPAVVTPFSSSGEVEERLLVRQAEYLCEHSVHGLFVGGTTAEGPYLTEEERATVFRLIKRISGGGQTLYLAILRPHTQQVIDEMKRAEELEPDYIAAVPPFYYGVTQRSIIDHFVAVAEIAAAPVVLYNIPQNTYNPMTLDTILELSRHPNIAGIKDSSGAFITFTHGLLHNFDDFAWIQGEDLLDAPSLLFGAPGLVTGLGNVSIEPYVTMYRAAQEGDIEMLRSCQRAVNRLAGIIEAADGAGVPAIKAATALLGRGSERMRVSSMTLGRAQLEAIRAVLAREGLL